MGNILLEKTKTNMPLRLEDTSDFFEDLNRPGQVINRNRVNHHIEGIVFEWQLRTVIHVMHNACGQHHVGFQFLTIQPEPDERGRLKFVPEMRIRTGHEVENAATLGDHA